MELNAKYIVIKMLKRLIIFENKRETRMTEN